LTALSFAAGYLPAAGQAVDAEAVAMDAFGDTYITGGFSGTVSIGGFSLTSAGNSDVYIAKLNPTGTIAWARRAGSANTADGDFGRGIAVDATGNVYVTGFITGTSTFGPNISVPSAGGRDVFVTKLDSSGNFLWAKTFGGPGTDLADSIAVGASGNVFVTGSFQQTANFGGVSLTSAGGDDVFVMKLDTNGNVIWAKRQGGAGVDSAFSVSLDGTGNVFTTGIFSGTATFGPTMLTSAGDTDIFVQKMDNNGNTLYAKRFGGTDHDDGVSLVADAAGNVAVTGDFVGTVTFGATTLTQSGTIPGSALAANAAFVTKLDPAGNVLWAKSFGTPNESSAGFGIAKDATGNLYTTGVFQGTVAFGGTNLTSVGLYDIYEAQLDSAGNVLNARSFGSTNNDQAFGIAVGGPNTSFTLVGTYGGPANVGTTALPSPLPGTRGAYVVQFTQAAAPPPFEPPSDFDGVHKTEPAVFRRSTSQWFVNNPTTGGHLFTTFGAPNLFDIPVAGDYLALGKTQAAVFRPSTSQWFVNNPATGGQLLGTFGAPNLFDIPVPADYQGVGKTQMAVFRPSTSQWFVNGATGGTLLATFGAPNLTDIPVPGDYDGVGHAELAVFRPSTSQWFILRPNGVGGQLMATFGAPNLFDIPVPGDYDGTGHMQMAVYRPSTSQLFVYRPTGGALVTTFGAPNLVDIPTQASAGYLKLAGRVGGLSIREVAPVSGFQTVVAPAPSASSSMSAAPAVPAAAGGKAISTGNRSQLVASQGGTTSSAKKDLWSSAIENLFGGAEQS
jgi:hypothetical protein